MPPIRLRDQFGFRPHLDLHHGSLLHLHRISELPTSDWSLSDNPAGLAPKSVGASMLFKFGPWIGMACRKSHCFNIAWSWGRKRICLDARFAFQAPFVSGDDFLTKFFKCQPVQITRWNKSLKNQDCSVLPLNSVAPVKTDVQMMLFEVQLATDVRYERDAARNCFGNQLPNSSPFYLEWPTLRNVKLTYAGWHANWHTDKHVSWHAPWRTVLVGRPFKTCAHVLTYWRMPHGLTSASTRESYVAWHMNRHMHWHRY